MLRYLFFLFIFAIIISVGIVIVIRWIMPLFNYCKKNEEKALKNFSNKLEEKKPEKKPIKRKPGRPKKK